MAIDKLLKRLNHRHDDLVMIRTNECLDAKTSKLYLDILLEKTNNEGTLVMLGDCEFNTSAEGDDFLMALQPQERFILSSTKMMQLASLKHESQFAYHPGISLLSLGKYAKLFSRPQSLDFPYGEESVFSDLYDLNAVIIFVSAKHIPFEAKYALHDLDEKVIIKNTSAIEGELIPYLDYEVNWKLLHGIVFGSGLMLYEIEDDLIIYGVRYKDYIDYIKKRIVFD
ncbi:AAC(3) family N-acetyltransferase [Erysipelothrix urinaevulpis]|uniref:AAC(3) family N-acetyltransferase n=1 Tax=Erysipelothrix urinaevulpis TaxID=2683717 RepID=UPI001358BB81|nr:AAC(3) family N-acetyltransferase [Erysipelothrix urinaevulpis]